MTQITPTDCAPPRFSAKEACALARRLYGLSASATPLPGEQDRNFLLQTNAGPAFVLKIANAAESRNTLEAQNAALRHLAQRASALHCPRVRPARGRQSIATARGPGGAEHLIRMLTYVPGHLLVEASPHSPELLASLGAFFGRLDRALTGFSHPALTRDLHWDLAHASGVVTEHLPSITTAARRGVIERFLSRFQRNVEPLLPELRRSVIHNDGNDHNVLVTDIRSRGGRVTGIVDFGDLVDTCTIFEIAICSAYAILDKPDPVFAAAQVIGGYHAEHPLLEAEMELLYDLVAMRLCTSVALSASRKTRVPGNPYLTISEAPAWAALEQLAQTSPRLFLYTVRSACGLSACPRSSAVVQWLKDHVEDVGPVIEPDLRKGQGLTIDLTAGSADLPEVGDPADTPKWTEAIFGRMAAAGVQVGLGRYGEARRGYTAGAYRPEGSGVDGWRTVHLGMDLFLAPGSPVFAPLDGTIHSVARNDRPQDYGPTIILRHEVPQAGEFFTLYGHLSPDSLDGLSVGARIAKGARLGTVGETSVNGNWPPHLHVQVVVDTLDHAGTFPGVCAARDRELWLSLCPDPNLLLGVPNLPPAEPEESLEASVEARRHYLGPNLSVSYERPLKIVRAWNQYVYDHLGREYLDATNNVAHVGHGHPAVVRAATEQMRLVNSNTRYLHDSLTAYAERLCRTLPDPLRICFFVCSGSEANELALRLARTHTGGTDLIVVEGGYHGNTSALVDISSYKFDGPGGRGAPAHVRRVPTPDTYRGQYRDHKTAGRKYAQHVLAASKQITSKRRRVAAFIAESMLSCAGQIVPPPGYLEAAYRHVRSAGGVCIADEVQVGFGRVGSHFWGFETQGIVPDIVTMGKPMGNGYPIGAVVTTPEIAASFDTGMEYFNTFGGTPVACAVGMAVLDVIEQEGLQQHAQVVGKAMMEGLTHLRSRHQMIGDVRGRGLFVGIELVRDRKTLEPATPETAYVAERLKELGVLAGTDGPFRNVLKIKPPMVFTTGDADRLAGALDRILTEPRLRLLQNPL